MEEYRKQVESEDEPACRFCEHLLLLRTSEVAWNVRGGVGFEIVGVGVPVVLEFSHGSMHAGVRWRSRKPLQAKDEETIWTLDEAQL